MKKKLLSVILTIVMIAGLVACTNGVEEGNSVSDNDVVEVSDNQSDEEDDGQEEAGPSGNYDETDMWILRTEDFGENMDSFDGTLFHTDAVIPLVLEDIDTFASPYLIWMGFGEEDVLADTAQEALASQVMIGTGPMDDSLTIYTRTTRDDGGRESLDSQGNGLMEIVVCNLGEEDLPLSECYANGWWYAVGSDTNWDDTLVMEDIDEYNVEINSIISKFGAPDYIAPDGLQSYMEKEEWYAYIEEQDTVTYSFIYEYSDYVIDIGLCDYANDQSGSEVGILYINYYPMSYWTVAELYDTFYDLD